MRVLIDAWNEHLRDGLIAVCGQQRWIYDVVDRNGGQAIREWVEAYDHDVICMARDDELTAKVVRRLRQRGLPTPIVALVRPIASGRRHIVEPLRAGCDDVIERPVHPAEFTARALAVVARSRGHCSRAITHHDLVVDLDAQCAFVKGRLVPLSPKQYQVLELLVMKRGTTLSRDRLFHYLYSETTNDLPVTKTLDMYISQARKKLAKASGGDAYIETVMGRGYLVPSPAMLGEAA